MSDRYPLYSKKPLTLKEMAIICVGEQVDLKNVSREVPQNIRQNATYVVDASGLNKSDITTDLTVYMGHSCPSEKVRFSL